jgi:hypothetical protein
MTRSAL